MESINKEIIIPHPFKVIHAHASRIYRVAFFPSNKFVSICNDHSIKIWDENYKCIQIIVNAHDDIINYVTIKDEDNFVTCSADKSIRFWKKTKNNEFILNVKLLNAHKKNIGKIIYSDQRDIYITCSLDNSVKIWVKQNDSYQCTTQLSHLSYVRALLIMEDKNILVTSGWDGTRFWDLYYFHHLDFFNNVEAGFTGDTVARIDEDKFVFGGTVEQVIKIFSFKKKKIIHEIQNDFEVFGIQTLNKYFLICGWSNDFKVFRNDNFNCVQIVKDAHFDNIKGFNISNDKRYKLIVSYSYDGDIKFWAYNE